MDEPRPAGQGPRAVTSTACEVRGSCTPPVVPGTPDGGRGHGTGPVVAVADQAPPALVPLGRQLGYVLVGFRFHGSSEHPPDAGGVVDDASDIDQAGVVQPVRHGLVQTRPQTPARDQIIDADSRLPGTGRPTLKKGAGHTGPSPVDRGKPGSKIHVLPDANGLPPPRRRPGRQHPGQRGSEADDRGSPNETRPSQRPVLQAAASPRGESLRLRRPAQTAALEAHRSAHRP